ncbi:hypothetical protein C8J56DRAFT_1094487 [Mycena floridula]|nr:hypothetical protein C8J56DRAFT_1094487 [Mycena floridula]
MSVTLNLNCTVTQIQTHRVLIFRIDSDDDDESNYQTANESYFSEGEPDEYESLSIDPPQIHDFSAELSHIELGNVYHDNALSQLYSCIPYPGDDLVPGESVLVSERFGIMQRGDDYVIWDDHRGWHPDFEDGVIVPGDVVREGDIVQFYRWYCLKSWGKSEDFETGVCEPKWDHSSCVAHMVSDALNRGLDPNWDEMEPHHRDYRIEPIIGYEL